MGSRGKRKLDDHVSKGPPGIKKVKTDLMEGSSSKPPSAVKDLCVRKQSCASEKLVYSKKSTLDSDLKKNIKDSRKKKYFKKSKKKVHSASKKDLPSVTSNKGRTSLQGDNTICDTALVKEGSGLSVQKKHKNGIKGLSEKTDAKPNNETVEAKINENVTSQIKAVNLSCNWKMLQKVLKTEKKTPRIHKSSHVRKDRPFKTKKPPVKVADNKTETETKPKIWFDDVDDILIESLKRKEDLKSHPKTQQTAGGKSVERLVKSGSYEGVTKTVAMDCEMVGVGEGGKESVLARVSIVNQFGQCIYDKYVKPQEHVTDYRTHVSGIRPEDVKHGEEFSVVIKDVNEILKNRVLVGHAIENDLKVLFLSHPRRLIRDTSKYKPFRKLFCGRTPALRKLADKLLMVKVQEGEHSSVQDAQAAMRLYTMYRKEWEKDIKAKRTPNPQSSTRKKIQKTKTFTSAETVN